jgi:hypothetical protein
VSNLSPCKCMMSKEVISGIISSCSRFHAYSLFFMGETGIENTLKQQRENWPDGSLSVIAMFQQLSCG